MACAPHDPGLWSPKRKTKQPSKSRCRWVKAVLLLLNWISEEGVPLTRARSLCFYRAAGLMSLGVPCQQFQLHMLTQQLKTFNDTISYEDLMKQIQSLRWNKLISLSVFDYLSFYRFMSLLDFISHSDSAELHAQIPGHFIKRQEPVETENVKHQQRLQNTEAQRYWAHYVLYFMNRTFIL